MFVALSRQYGALGTAVAVRVADALGWTFVDNALVAQVAASSGVSPDEAASDVARRDRVVMIARAAAAAQATERDGIHARLVAPREYRIRMVVEHYDVPPEEAPGRVDETDFTRERYHLSFYKRDWNDPLDYHLVLNTERLGIDVAADLIVALARSRGW